MPGPSAKVGGADCFGGGLVAGCAGGSCQDGAGGGDSEIYMYPTEMSTT